MKKPVAKTTGLEYVFNKGILNGVPSSPLTG